MTIWRMRIACWIPKATNTLRMCNTYCQYTATMGAGKHLVITLYVQYSGCVVKTSNKFVFLRLCYDINPLNTNRSPLYLNPQSVPRCKHFSSRL
jgi:hypothetical protein